MAIRIDRPQFRALFGRMAVHNDQSEELVVALEDAFDESLHGAATSEGMRLTIAAAVNELKAELAAREARMNLNLLVWLGVVLTAIGVATAAILTVLG